MVCGHGDKTRLYYINLSTVITRITVNYGLLSWLIMGNVSININEISRGMYGNVGFKKYIYSQHDEILWSVVELIYWLSLNQTLMCRLF